MRDLLAHANLDRYAGQFVWLELSYDEPRNSRFMTKFGATATPTFFVIAPQDETTAAMQTGAMSLTDLKKFLERGTSMVLTRSGSPADTALRRGDMLMAQQPGEAANAYKEALERGGEGWPNRELAQAALVQALRGNKQWRACAETAARAASGMQRDDLFTRIVVAGLWCLASDISAPWVDDELKDLQPLAQEALALPMTLRDYRDEVYRTLMYIEVARKHRDAALKWGDRWLRELDAITPHSDDERSALDIARVENVEIAGDPSHILPELKASEQAMPSNYNASLRLAQTELAAKQYSDALSACDRGLLRRPGSLGRAWLLMLKAQALQALGKSAEAHRQFENALGAAEEIPSEQSRESNIAKIKELLQSSGGQTY
jgi:tetratricopeptide (TPR) repeat protein